MSPPSSSSQDNRKPDGILEGRKMKLIEQRINQRYIRKKNSNDRKTTEGVFDTKTLFHLYYLITHGYISYLHGVISTGKEANVYYGERTLSITPTTTTSQGTSIEQPATPPVTNKITEVAIKIYRTSTADFKRMREYVHGDPRFQRIRHGTRPLVYAWTQKEYQNLNRMLRAKIKVPQPYSARGNILVMDFIGIDGLPAPLLKDYRIKDEKEAVKLFKKLFKYVKLLYRDAELVHADLSEYNVIMHKEPYLIDVSQSVPLEHPLADEYLERDITNLARYFTGLGIKIPSVEDLLEEVYQY